MASAVVRTGGTRLGIRIARPKCRAVNGSVARSISLSRTCRCQSSGLRMVRRSAMEILLNWLLRHTAGRRHFGRRLLPCQEADCLAEVGLLHRLPAVRGGESFDSAAEAVEHAADR